MTTAIPLERRRPVHPPAPAQHSTRSRAGGTGRLVLYASVIMSFLAASAAPTPLYQHYNSVWHGTALTTTTAFASYTAAVLIGLLVLGEISNQIGRRPVLLGAIAAQAAAVVLLATADSFTPLFLGRIVQGVAAGAALGTLGAAMIDTHRTRGTILNTAAPGFGTGFGALFAGLLVSYLPWPTHLIYLALLVIFAVQALAIARLPENSARTPGLLASLRPRIAVPAPARTRFLAVSPVLFATWALPGFYASLGPALIRDLAGSHSVVLGTVGLFLLAACASVAVVVLHDASAEKLMTIGITALAAGALGVAAAIAVGSAPAYLLASVVAGVGFGSGFQGGIRTVAPLASAEQRPGLLSAVYLVAYAGMGLPAVIAGYLVSRGHDLRPVAIGYDLTLLALAAAAALSLTVAHRRR